MSDNSRRPILYNGELYSSPISKGSSGPTKEPYVSFEVAREKVLSDLSFTKEKLRSIPSKSKLPNEAIICIRMQSEFSAKSYYPDSLFDNVKTKYGLKEIGSRIWKSIDEANVETGKLFFVRTTEDAISNFEDILSKEINITKKFSTDIRKISSIDILLPSEQVLGIGDDWAQGRLEAVLHPFNIDKDYALPHFLDLINTSGGDIGKVRFKQYGEGITFISFIGDKNILNAVSGYNPLRTIHPLKVRSLPASPRSHSIFSGPNPPTFNEKSQITVGVIDGGTNINPYLNNYVEIIESVSGSPLAGYMDHGTQVCGTVLYGPLNEFTSKDVLPEPSLSVKSFRVLSDDTIDPDLYEVIDAIEDIVPAHKEISVYNLSLGPAGPILDDSISRFTYSCDLLSKNHDILFCVAVGNDGDVDGYNRIQSPADMVNGLAVGAYTKIDGKIERASYSCIGPGREGNKMKPDLVAFGGCDRTPIHLIGSDVGMKVLSAGTSYASPLVARAAGLLIGGSSNILSPLIARALLIHKVAEVNYNNSHHIETGHGVLPDDINDIVSCPQKSYTLIYKGEITEGQYAEFQIPWENEIKEGKVTFRWTIAILTDVDHLSPDDYTTSGVEVTFYPNRSNYCFSRQKSGEKKKTQNINLDLFPEKENELILDGWVRSNFPVSESGKSAYMTEEELRANLKWDSLNSKNIKKRADKISNPFFHLHALGRGSRHTQGKVKFALIITVEAPKSTIDLYSTIIKNYSELAPINLNVKATLSVRT